MGQFVRTKGALSILDANALTALWNNPAIQKRWVRDQAAQKAATDAIGKVDKKAGETDQGNTRLVFDIMAKLPHGIHCTLKTDTDSVWGPLRADGMISPVGSVHLIHGSQISGEWEMIAVMDARPTTQEELDKLSQATEEAENSVHGVRNAIAGLGNLARKILGRPAGVYGVTPLLIYRTIRGL
jgi:hypothetical protein